VSDPEELLEAVDVAQDAFGHALGEPTFEPGVNAGPDATEGEVQIQKACRLLSLAHEIEALGSYYGAMLEHSFIATEHTIQGYLLEVTGAEASELRNHSTPYEYARGQVPLSDDTIDALEALYDGRRTQHYYGTTVTTETQATARRSVAVGVHDYVVGFDSALAAYCHCDDLE